jgi:hypothetical protein
MSHESALSLTPNIRGINVGKGKWDKETFSSSLGTFATKLFFVSSYCTVSNRLSFTMFARERGFTAIALLLVGYVKEIKTTGKNKVNDSVYTNL